ncbi:branched-chain-amino-acid transaminase [soil metagenome]
MIVYCNGFMPAADARVDIDDPGFLSGDGVFETALLHGGGFFRLRQHLERFRSSAATMDIAAPEVAQVAAIMRRLARDNDLHDASFRVTLTRGVGQPVLLVTARPLDADWTRRAATGWRVITARTRRPSTAAIPAQLKALGRTYALLARIEARAAGVDDALLLTDAGHICEGPSWNVFWIVGRTLYTPALEAGVLAGVTRTALIELAPEAGLDVEEGLFTREHLDRATEAFASMTSVGLVSLSELDGRRIDATAGAAALQKLYRQRVADEVAADPI